MSAQARTEVEELLKQFQQLTFEERSQFLEEAKQRTQREEEDTTQARVFLESRGLPVPPSPLAIRQKASLFKFLDEIKGRPRNPIDQSKLSEHDRVLYGQTFGDHE